MTVTVPAPAEEAVVVNVPVLLPIAVVGVAGIAPDLPVTDHVIPPEPDAVNVCENATPCVIVLSGVLEIVGATPTTLPEKMWSLEPTELVARSLNEYDSPATVGVPEKTPVVVSKLKPVGKAPSVDELYPVSPETTRCQVIGTEPLLPTVNENGVPSATVPKEPLVITGAIAGPTVPEYVLVSKSKPLSALTMKL